MTLTLSGRPLDATMLRQLQPVQGRPLKLQLLCMNSTPQRLRKLPLDYEVRLDLSAPKVSVD